MTELVQRSFCVFTYTKVGIGNYALEFRFLGGNYNLIKSADADLC